MPDRPTDARPALLEAWFDELDRLSRRRGDNHAAIKAHVDTFLAAAKDFETTTGQRAVTYGKLMAERIDRALASPFPITAARKEKFLYARGLLDAPAKRR